MSNEYIVKFSNNLYDEPVYAFAKVFKNLYEIPIINVINCESKISLLYQSITNNIIFNDDNMECILTNLNKINFDKNSSSAYLQFKNLVINMINTKYQTEFYPSGNVYYIGEVLSINDKKVPHGHGYLYYDSPNNKLKYIGEFENGNFDGTGVFYNKTGNISLKANNISNCIPTQKGTIFIKIKNKNEKLQIDFFEAWENLDNKAITAFVVSDDFVDKLTDSLCEFDNTTFDEIQFDAKSNDEKFYVIKKQLNEIKEYIDDKNNDIMKLLRFHNFSVVILEVIICFYVFCHLFPIKI
jgi:hypothetical protein